MERRDFLKSAGAGFTAGTLAAPAIANGQQPEVKWRCVSSFPKSLDTLFGALELAARRVGQVTGGKFQIRVFAGGEIVPALQVLDAVQNGTVECGHTPSYYYVGKDPTFAFDTAVPFGLNSRQQFAWMYHGGGLELMRDLFREYNVYNIPCGSTGAQMGGWFRKEVKALRDLKGLKMRITGFAGQVMQKLGVVPQQIPGGETYPALERGAIDAVEWVGPYDDEKLGFHKVAKYYYYPGWWEGGPMASFYVNLKQWESLPKEYQGALEAACAEASMWMLAKYDAQNPAALKRLVASGAQLRAFSKEILDASHAAAFEVYEETAAKNPGFRKVFEAWMKFRSDQHLWFRVAENAFDSYAYRRAAKK